MIVVWTLIVFLGARWSNGFDTTPFKIDGLASKEECVAAGNAIIRKAPEHDFRAICVAAHRVRP